MTGPDANARFAFGLDVIIAGLEAVSAAAVTPTTPEEVSATRSRA